MFLWLIIAILVAVCSVAGFIYLTRRISAFGFIKKLSKDKKVLKYAISAGLIVLTGGIIWLIWDWINAIMFAASCYILAFVRLVCVHWKEDIKETGKQMPCRLYRRAADGGLSCGGLVSLQ